VQCGECGNSRKIKEFKITDTLTAYLEENELSPGDVLLTTSTTLGRHARHADRRANSHANAARATQQGSSRMADDMTTIVVNPLPPRRRDVVAHLAAPKDAADNAAAAGALPPGWVEVHNNPVGGPMYYAHLQTRATSWVLPAAEPPALPAAAVVGPARALVRHARCGRANSHLNAGAKFFYFIEDSGETATSPIQAKDFVSLLASGQVTPDTLVWAQSLGEWTALRNVPALASMVAQADVMAPSDETNDPDETIEAAPREPNETIQAAPRHVFVCDNSTLLEVAWCFVFGVAAIPILVISIVVGLSGFMFVFFIGSFFPFLMFPPFAPVIISCLLFPIVMITFFIDWIFGHFYNANSNPSRCVAFWSGISLFVVAVVLPVLRRQA